MGAVNGEKLFLCKSVGLSISDAFCDKLTPVGVAVCPSKRKDLGIFGGAWRSRYLAPIKAMEASQFQTTTHVNGKSEECRASHNTSGGGGDNVSLGKNALQTSTIGNSTNILWHKCSIDKSDRQELLNQKGCVIWITGLSGSGKSTLACALSCALHARGKLSYILDGDNCRHGLNSDLSFKAEDRAENIRRIGEVAKLFADAGVISIASLISPFRRERDVCRALLPEGDFIEVYMDVPLKVCETRDPKGLYKLARAGKIKGFTGIDDPYEPPLNAEIALHQTEERCESPDVMAGTIVSYLERKGYLAA